MKNCAQTRQPYTLCLAENLTNICGSFIRQQFLRSNEELDIFSLQFQNVADPLEQHVEVLVFVDAAANLRAKENEYTTQIVNPTSLKLTSP